MGIDREIKMAKFFIKNLTLLFKCQVKYETHKQYKIPTKLYPNKGHFFY